MSFLTMLISIFFLDVLDPWIVFGSQNRKMLPNRHYPPNNVIFLCVCVNALKISSCVLVIGAQFFCAYILGNVHLFLVLLPDLSILLQRLLFLSNVYVSVGMAHTVMK